MTMWMTFTFTTMTYDANNNVLTEITQSGITGTLVNDSKDIYTYNATNHKLTSQANMGNRPVGKQHL